LASSVDGIRIDFNDTNLRKFADLNRLRKIYKLNTEHSARDTKKVRTSKEEIGNSSQQTNGNQDEIDEFDKLEAVILGIMTLKGS
jgi:hypothetical protein